MGRPKDIAKRAAIIAAAKSLFAQQPFEAVTMEAVAAQAAVSKMTVYSHFHDKETLFETIVAATATQVLSALPSSATGGGDLRERLIAVGRSFLAVILGPEVCRMANMLPGMLRNNKALAERFHAAGPNRVRSALAATIAAAAARGELSVDDTELAADDLVSLWEGKLPPQIAFGLAEPPSPEEIEFRVRRGTDVFLRAYRRVPTSGDAE